MPYQHYRIRLLGELNPLWSTWLNGLKVTHIAGSAQSETEVCGLVGDQVALRSLLNRMWDLNLTILSVICTDES
jgi:hypothetical protein